VTPTIRSVALSASALAALLCGPVIAGCCLQTGESVMMNSGAFIVESDGSGQLSTNLYRVNVATSGVLQVVYLAARRHCSSVKIHFRVDDAEKAVSGPVAPGRSSGLFDLGPVERGIHEVALQAEGIPGGCNAGRLMSWQGSVTLYVSLLDDDSNQRTATQ
jgi:hypothetical protein